MSKNTFSRREFLRLAGLVAAGATVSACTSVYDKLAGDPKPVTNWPEATDDDFRILSRLTFGPRVEERQRVAEIGAQAWIEEQLTYESIPDHSLNLRLQKFETLTMSATEIADWSGELFDNENQDWAPTELRQATLLRQVYSHRQLYEVMVEFWTDHFNISTAKGDGWFLKTVDDREVIRQHALGKFRDLLWASAHSPAMLVYLDNQVNAKGAPNENYAREVMELHTLGVNGGYTQQDVMELARCLTGWTVKDSFWRGDFTFKPETHDDGIKTVLGLTLEPNGQHEAEQMLDVLATHPSTARFIATKLVRRFIADEPPPELVERASTVFTQTDGDIRAVLRAILLDGLITQPALVQPKFKRPINFITSALRQLNARTEGGEALHDYLARLGQVHFTWPTPDGFPDRTSAWRGNLMPRWQFALALARDEINGTKINLSDLMKTAKPRGLSETIDQLGALLLGAPLPAQTRDNLIAALRTGGANEDESLPSIITAGLVASPAFQWR